MSESTEWQLPKGATFYIAAFLVVFFFFFTRAAPTVSPSGNGSERDVGGAEK